VRILVSALSCNAEVGSEALVGYSYATALARQHEVTILTSPPAQVPAGAKLILCDAGPCSFNEIGPMPLSRFELRQIYLAKKLHRQQRFDCIHRVTPSAIQLPTLIPLLGIPYIVGPLIAADRPPASFDLFLKRPVTAPDKMRFHPQRLISGITRRVTDQVSRSQWHLRKAARIIVGTECARRQVPEPLRDKCVSIPYTGVEHERFLPPAQRPARSKVRLLFVGRLIPYKGVELLLRAVALAAKKCELELNLVGDSDSVFKTFCAMLAAELGLKQVVNFIPQVPRAELPHFYQDADIFCFPTLCDTYGIALLEAMSAGCAAIVSDVAGAAEIVPPGTGIKVPLKDPEQYIHDYAEAIVGLAGNTDLRAQLGVAARRHIIRNHDWENIGQELLKFYQSLLGSI
jgi:glycosyltransferase involved in cell wall biosynthesis